MGIKILGGGQVSVEKTSGGVAVKTDKTISAGMGQGKLGIDEDVKMVGAQSVHLPAIDPVLTEGSFEEILASGVSHPAMVSLVMSYTKQLEPYHSLKVQVGLDLPCDNTPEAIESTFAQARNFIETKIDELANGE